MNWYCTLGNVNTPQIFGYDKFNKLTRYSLSLFFAAEEENMASAHSQWATLH